MQHDNVFLKGIALRLGERSISKAQAAPAREGDQLAIRIAPRPATGPSLATAAALDALRMARLPASELGPIFYATAAPTLTNQAHDAAHVRHALGVSTSDRLALTLAAGPQGVITALQLAATYLEQPHAGHAATALVSAGAVWSMDAASRWLEPAPHGDGAGAIVVDRTPGKAQLLATAIHTDATLAQRSYTCAPADVRAHVVDVLADVVEAVLADADLAPSSVRYLITPFGNGRPELSVGQRGGGVDQHELATLIARGRHLGHLGPSDLIAGITWLHRRPGTPASTGDHVLLLADSGGDSVGAALIRAK